MKIEILSIALVDIQSDQHFYEQKQEGLGVSFWICWFSTLMLFMLYAGIHQQFFGYYRALSKRFPYAIYYRVSEQTVQVWRVLDCRQKPSRIADALRT